MLGLRTGTLFLERPADVHQAAAVLADHPRGTGRAQRVGLVLDHRAGDIGLLDREGPAEAAALCGALRGAHLDVFELAEQLIAERDPESAVVVVDAQSTLTDGPCLDAPVTVLVDGSTASAAVSEATTSPLKSR